MLCACARDSNLGLGHILAARNLCLRVDGTGGTGGSGGKDLESRFGHVLAAVPPILRVEDAHWPDGSVRCTEHLLLVRMIMLMMMMMMMALVRTYDSELLLAWNRGATGTYKKNTHTRTYTITPSIYF